MPNLDLTITLQRAKRILDKALEQIEARAARGEEVPIEVKDALRLALQMKELEASGMLGTMAPDDEELHLERFTTEELRQWQALLALAEAPELPKGKDRNVS